MSAFYPSRRVSRHGGAAGLGAVAAAAALVGGCAPGDVPVLQALGDDAGAVEGAAPAPIADATSEPTSDTSAEGGPGGGLDGDTREAYCAGSGPPYFVVTEGDAGLDVTQCTSTLAQIAFRYALCTCAGYVSSHALTTDAFDSTQGPYSPASVVYGGSVGTNGDLNATGTIAIRGSLWATGANGLTTNAALSADGELHALGGVHAGPSLVVGADAWLAGGVQTAGDVSVGGTLHVPASAPVSVGGAESIGALAREAVVVSPACDCDAQTFVDVPGIVDAHSTINDDAALGIDPAALENVGTRLTETVLCGRVFFTSINATAPVQLNAQGRVAIFVGRDLSTTSDFVVNVPQGSEVDLFVGGNVQIGGTLQIGDVTNPARARTYVGGTGTVNLQGSAELAGNLYAPRADLVLGGSAPTTLYGSIFAKRISAGADLTIHYDEAILGLAAPSSCAPPPTCTTCRDCGDQACTGGKCGACTDSTQCCSPLVCRSGRCVANIR